MSEDVGRSARSLAAAADAGGDGDGDAGSVIAQLRARCEQLSQKCDLYEQEVSRLNGKLERFIHEVAPPVFTLPVDYSCVFQYIISFLQMSCFVPRPVLISAGPFIEICMGGKMRIHAL